MAFQPFFKISSNFNPNQSQHHSVTLIKAKNDLFDEELAKGRFYTRSTQMEENFVQACSAQIEPITNANSWHPAHFIA